MSGASNSGATAGGLLDPTSLLGRWWAEIAAFAKKPISDDNTWVDYVILVLIGATIVFLWNKILEAHLPDIG